MCERERETCAADSAQVRRTLVSLLPYQRQALLTDERFTWNCWSRQTGKSFTFSLRRLLRGLHRRRNQIILSAGERQSLEVMEKVRRHCQALQIWCDWHGHGFFRGTSLRQLEARLPGGVRIIGLPANPMTARGFTGDVFLDEFAMHADDDAIWSALFPTVLRGEGELDVASTPRGQKNVFYRLRDNPRFRRRTVTLADAVTAGLDVDVAALREAIGDEIAWRQEFCCEFVDEATSFLTHALIRSCQDVQLAAAVDWERLRRPGVRMYAGVDVGRWRDVTAIWLWERAGDTLATRGVEVLQAAPFSEQEAAIGRLLEERGLRRCCIDATGLGLQLVERLAERFGDHRVEGVAFTAALKSELAGRLRVLAERGRLRIPVDEGIVNDWHSIARLVTGAGHVRFDADRSGGGHGDRFWAAALGLHAADEPSGEAGLATGGRLTFARDGVW
jgi:phage FluMu gp28-like protein